MKKLSEKEVVRICGMCYKYWSGHSPACGKSSFEESNTIATNCPDFKYRKRDFVNDVEDGRSARLFLLYLLAKYRDRYFAENRGREDKGTIFVFNGRFWTSNFEKVLLPKEVAIIYGDIEGMPNLNDIVMKFKGRCSTKPPEKLPPAKIPFLNCLYDLNQNLAMFHNPKYFYTEQDLIPIEFNPHAECPITLDYLLSKVSITPFQTFHRAVGSVLWRGGITPYLLIILGPSQTGKTTFREMIIHAFSDSKVSLIRTLSLTELNKDAPEIAGRIKGSILNWGDENGRVFKNVDTLKRRVCNATEECRRLYENSTSENIHCKFFNSANEVPMFYDEDGNAGGFNNRLQIVMWNRKGDFVSTIEGLPFEEYYKNKAYEERQGLINWMLDGLFELIHSDWRLSEDDEHEKMLTLYQELVNKKPVVEFFNSTFVQNHDPHSKVSKRIMYDLYKTWHVAGKKDGCPLTFNKYCRRVKAELDLEDDSTHKFWIGVGYHR